MNRRSGPWFVRILFAAALTLGVLIPQAVRATPPPVGVSAPALAPATASAGTVPNATPPLDTVPTDEIIVDEANPFLPEDRDLTSCVGLVQRPGCGSEARGGWHQNAVAIAMIGGLLLVFGRIAWGVRRSQKQMAASPPD